LLTVRRATRPRAAAAPHAARRAAQDLARPEAMYRALGAKLVVGMPFKDQATSDSLLLPAPPPVADREGRRALARLQARPAPPPSPPRAAS